MINEKQARKYCSEDISLIENYAQTIADTAQTWDIHHRRETDENVSLKQLIEEGFYYGRPAAELIFLTSSDHTRLHNKGKHCSEETRRKMIAARKGKHHSEETKQKIRQAKIGNKNMLGKKHSEETKQKMSEAKRGRKLSDEHKKNLSEAMRGRQSPMFGKHHSEEAIKKMSDARRRYYAKKKAAAEEATV